MKTLNTLGANIELLAVSSGEEEIKYAYTVLYNGERRRGWFNAPISASDEWLGVWSLLKAEFDDEGIMNAVFKLFEGWLENATPADAAQAAQAVFSP